MNASTPCIPENAAGLLTELGPHGARHLVRMGRLSGRQLDVTLDAPLPLDSPVKIEWGDYFVLAEVCRCEQRGGTYHTGLHLMGGLFESESLRRLNEVISAWQ